MKVKSNVVNRTYVYCPICNNNKELEVVIRSHNHHGIEVVDLPDWFGEDGELVWDIDNLGWELEQNKIKVGA